MSKKIISLVLAVLMVFSVFAVSAFAVGPVSQIGIKFVTNAKVGDAAGTEITVDCYLSSDISFENQGRFRTSYL